MNDVRVRLHRPFVKSDGKIKIHPLYQTGTKNARFLLNGSLKFEANKAGSFEFDILPAHPCYSLLRRYRHYVSVTINETEDIWPEDGDDEEAEISFDPDENGEIVFYGRIISISMSFNRAKHVTCEGILANLIDAPMFNDMSHDVGTLADYHDAYVKVITLPDGSTLRKVVARHTADGDESKELYRVSGDPNMIWKKCGDAYANIMKRYDFYFEDANISSDTVEDIDVYCGESVGDFLTSQLIEIYGGFIHVDYEIENDGSMIGRLSWIPDPSMNGFNQNENPQPIEFGVNLLDLNAEFSDNNAVNGICVAWTTSDDKKKWKVETIPSITSSIHSTIGVPYVFGSRTAAVEFIEVPGISTQASAKRYATAYKNKFCTYDFSQEKFDSYTVKAIDRHYTNPDVYETPIKLYDQVRLISSPHDVNQVFTCTSVSYSLDNPVVRSYNLEIYRPKPSSDEKVLSKQIGRKIKYKDPSSGTVSDNETVDPDGNIDP